MREQQVAVRWVEAASDDGIWAIEFEDKTYRVALDDEEQCRGQRQDDS